MSTVTVTLEECIDRIRIGLDAWTEIADPCDGGNNGKRIRAKAALKQIEKMLRLGKTELDVNLIVSNVLTKD